MTSGISINNSWIYDDPNGNGETQCDLKPVWDVVSPASDAVFGTACVGSFYSGNYYAYLVKYFVNGTQAWIYYMPGGTSFAYCGVASLPSGAALLAAQDYNNGFIRFQLVTPYGAANGSDWDFTSGPASFFLTSVATAPSNATVWVVGNRVIGANSSIFLLKMNPYTKATTEFDWQPSAMVHAGRCVSDGVGGLFVTGFNGTSPSKRLLVAHFTASGICNQYTMLSNATEQFGSGIDYNGRDVVVVGFRGTGVANQWCNYAWMFDSSLNLVRSILLNSTVVPSTSGSWNPEANDRNHVTYIENTIILPDPASNNFVATCLETPSTYRCTPSIDYWDDTSKAITASFYVDLGPGDAEAAITWASGPNLARTWDGSLFYLGRYNVPYSDNVMSHYVKLSTTFPVAPFRPLVGGLKGDAFAAYNDDFNSPSLDPRWTILNQQASYWSLSAVPGNLQLHSLDGEICAGYTQYQNMFVETMPSGDFDVVLHVSNIQYTSVGSRISLIIWKDTDNYVLVDYVTSSTSGKAEVYLGSEVSGTPTYNYSLPTFMTSPYLLLSKQGTNYTGYYSTNGTSWQEIYSLSNSVSFAQIGIWTANGKGIPAEGTTNGIYDVDYIHFGAVGSFQASLSTPSAPLNLQATGENGQASLTWQVPSSNGGSAIGAYQVYMGTTPGGESWLWNVTTTTYKATGLTNGATYYFQVAAVNMAGTGPRSNEASATPSSMMVSSDQNGDEWPMFRGALNHTGTVITTPVVGSSALWKFNQFSYNTSSSPVIANGRVFVASGDGTVHCFDATTGASIWNYTTGGMIRSSPAVAGGRVYVGSYDGKVYCLNATTGAIAWSYTTGGGMDSSPAVAGGRVYVGSWDHKIYCLNATTGALAWNYTTGGSVYSSPAVTGGRVYVGSLDGKVYCLNTTTGALAWSYTTGGYVYSSPAVAGGFVYVGSYDHKVYCLNASSGAFNWSYTTGNVVTSSPAVVANRVYVGSWDRKMYCLNAATGALSWNYTTGGDVDSSPAVAGGCVYVVIWDKIYCLDSITGAQIWNYFACCVSMTSPAISGGCVYLQGLYSVYCLPMIISTGTVPSAPQYLQATGSNNKVDLSWTAPVSNGGTPITGYKVYQGTTLNGETLLATIGNITTYTATGLTNGQVYYFKVAAVNALSTGAQSNEANAMPASVPGAPTSLTATAGSGQVTLNWALPASNGGSLITGYMLWYGQVPSTPWGRYEDNVLSDTITGLTTGQIYCFKVQAMNAIGWGANSTTVNATPATMPSAPLSLSAQAGSQRITLTWVVPANDGGSAIGAYQVYMGTTPGGETWLWNVTTTTYTATGLTNGVTYYFQVAAVNMAGTGARSNEASATPSSVMASSDQNGDEWPMFRGGLNHTGVATTTPVQGTGLTWNYTTGNGTYSSPTVTGGRVYVGSADHNVYCLNATTGAKIWKFATGGYIESAPAVAGNRLYVGSWDHKIYCLYTTNGTLAWSNTTGGEVDTSSPAVADGRVYVGCLDGKVYCLDAMTGSSIWNYTTGNWVESSPAVADSRVYVGSEDGKVYCLDATTGFSIWNYTTSGIVDSSPAVTGLGAFSRVYVGSNDDKVYCLNGSSGTCIWSYTTGGTVDSSPAVAGGRVYVGCGDGKVYCLYASNGTMIWSSSTGGAVCYSSPAVAGGRVYVGNWDCNVYCLNATTGARVWNYTTGGWVFSSPAVVGGRVYVWSGDGKIYCLPMVLASQNHVPVLNLVFSLNGRIFSNPVHLTINITCGDWPVQQAWCVVDRSTTYVLTRINGTALSGFYSASVDLTSGSHVLTFFVDDTHGNTKSLTITITVITITPPPNDSTIIVIIVVFIIGVAIGVAIPLAYNRYKYRSKQKKPTKSKAGTYTQSMDKVSPEMSQEADKRSRLLAASIPTASQEQPYLGVKVAERCTLHKGLIVGPSYTCKTCGAVYCIACTKQLIETGENCWNCGSLIDAGGIVDDDQQGSITGENEGTLTVIDPDILAELRNLYIGEEIQQDFLQMLKEIPPEKRRQFLDDMFRLEFPDDTPF